MSMNNNAIGVKITGTGRYLPEKVVTNQDLEKQVDTSDEWIRTRTGIEQRHIAREDEPTSALDPELVGEVLQVMRDLADEGRTMLVVTHEMSFARDVSSHVMFLHEGTTEAFGPAKQVFDNPESDRMRQFIGLTE